MRYAYQKWYLFILIIGVVVIGVWYELPQWQLYSSLISARQNKADILRVYQTRYTNKQISIHQKPSFIHETSQTALETLLSTVQKSGLILQSVQLQTVQDKTVDLFPVLLKVNGRFAEVLQFLQLLQRTNQSVIIEHLQIESSSDVLIVTFHLSLYLFKPTVNVVFVSPLKIQNPFCGANILSHATHPIDDEKLLQQLSLSQIAMLGVMQNGFERTAWLGLPDGRMMSVGLHAIIGKEQGNIVAIHQHSMQILLPNQKIITLTL
jgi:hypothetical protein